MKIKNIINEILKKRINNFCSLDNETSKMSNAFKY